MDVTVQMGEEQMNLKSTVQFSPHGDSSPASPKVERHNVMILTGGLTGSSALAGLLTAAGYWCGEDTFRKSDYNTYENSDLIRLNRQLMQRVAVGDEYTSIFLPDAIRQIEALGASEPRAEYSAFVSACNRHQPWVWKDPRLWLTIRFWHPLIDWSRVRVLLLSRDPMQSWISTLQRRQIQTYGYLSRYNEAIQASLREFLHQQEVQYLPVQYEDLVVSPERELARIGGFLETPLTLEHLTSTYTGPLRRKPKTWRDGVEAGLIFLKNYGERIG
jgi:hypothetical protein